MARAKCRPTLEQMLVGLIVVLTLWGIVVQVMVRSYVRQERSLTSGDEDRLAEETATIENELVQQFAPQQLDVWASESGDADERRPGVPDAADPNVPNANGEFTVSQTQLGRLARTCVDTHRSAPRPPHCTYGLRVPASCRPYVPRTAPWHLRRAPTADLMCSLRRGCSSR